jgi:hypothetical protein
LIEGLVDVEIFFAEAFFINFRMESFLQILRSGMIERGFWDGIFFKKGKGLFGEVFSGLCRHGQDIEAESEI